MTESEYAHVPPLCPKLVISAATLPIEHYDRGARRDRFVNKMLHEVGLPPDAPWAAAFIQSVGHWSHYQHHDNFSLWPIPSTAQTCEDLHRFAAERNMFESEPLEGDIVLVCSRRSGAYRQGGFLVDIKPWRDDRGAPQEFHCVTIEGDTDHEGALNGGGICRVRRVIEPAKGDCFIRWTKGDPRGVSADPKVETEVVMGRTRVRVA